MGRPPSASRDGTQPAEGGRADSKGQEMPVRHVALHLSGPCGWWRKSESGLRQGGGSAVDGVRIIKRELPALMTTFQQLSETSGDVEAYDLSIFLDSQVGVASVVFLSEVLNIVEKMRAAMQMKTADISKLPILLRAKIELFENLKNEDSDWLSNVQSTYFSLGLHIVVHQRLEGFLSSGVSM